MKNPYIGPRPFTTGDHGRFFGRDLEIEEITSHLFASRVLVLYAESGAGKTSLLNAGVLPEISDDFYVLPVSRVSGAVPQGVDESAIENLAVHHALSAWNRQLPAIDPVSMTLAEAVAAVTGATDGRPILIVFDQFEELFTGFIDRPGDRSSFFDQIGACLRTNPDIKVLLSLREDFLGELNAHVDRLFVDYRHRRYRLERLGAKAALQAVLGPLPHGEPPRAFADGVADHIVRELREVRLAGQTQPLLGEFVEPVQLQVVCETLWNNLLPEIAVISHEHARRFGDVTTALTTFYTSALAKAASGIKGRESKVRAFFDDQLITSAGTRGTVVEGKTTTGDIPNSVISALENAHVVRAEESRGARWYELTHDRLIEPVRAANAAWRTRRRKRWAVAGGIVTMAAVVAVSVVTTAAIQGGAASDPPDAADSYRNADLRGRDFSGQDMGGEDFTGSDLTGADFSSSTLVEAIFVETDLTEATFTGAIMSRSDLSYATLSGTTFFEADLTAATLQDIAADTSQQGNALGASVGESSIASTALNALLPGRSLVLRVAAQPDSAVGCDDPNARNRAPDFRDAVLRDTDFTNAGLAWAQLAGATLDGADLSGADLGCAELSGVVLRGATLVGTNLAEANLPGAALTDADLSDANLAEVTAGGADFSRTTLSRTDFANADLNRATFEGAVLSETSLIGAILAGANFEGVDLTLIGQSDLAGSDLTSARLVAAKLGQLDLSGARLTGAVLTETDLVGTDLTGADLTDAQLDRALMSTAVLRDTRLGGANLTSADLFAAVLVGADLTNTSIEGASLAGADLTGTDLTVIKSRALGGVDFGGSILAGATFDGMSMGGLSFDMANLSGAHLVNAQLLATSLVGANLTGADLTNASLIGADLSGADATGILGVGTDLGGADLTDITATNADLTDAVLAGASLDGASFDNANLTRANLGSVDLRGVGLRGVRLTDANLARSVLDGANLSGSSLSGANLGESSLAAANLANADLQGSLLIGADLDGATLTNANLSGAVLTRATLRDASLTNADMAGATLAQTDLTGATVNGADLNRADLTAATLVAAKLAGTNLSGANLTNADFSDSDMTLADLRNGVKFESCDAAPDLALFATRTTGTQFAGADLTKAFLDGVDLRGATGLGLSMDPTTGLVFGPMPANLTGVSARGASFPDDMRNAQLRDAQLQCADFTDSDMTQADLRDSQMAGATLRRVQMLDRDIGTLVDGDWIAPDPRTLLAGADLPNVDLSGSTLLAAVFDGVDLTSADFSGAMLRESSFVDATLTHAVFSAATLGAQSFSEIDNPFGPSVLRDATLDHAIFEAADLVGVDFSGADIRYAVLSNAIIDGASLATADIRHSLLDVLSESGATYPAGLRPPGITSNATFASGTVSIGTDEGAIWTSSNGVRLDGRDPLYLVVTKVRELEEELDIREFAVADDAIWAIISTDTGPSLAHIDETGKVASTSLPGPGFGLFETKKLKVIDGVTWVFANGRYLTRAGYDGTQIATEVLELPSSAHDVTISNGFVWVASGGSRLHRVDWATGDSVQFPIGEHSDFPDPVQSVVAHDGYLWIVTENQFLDPDGIGGRVFPVGALYRLPLSDAVAWDGEGDAPDAELVLADAHGSSILVVDNMLWISQAAELAIVAVDPEYLALTTRLCTVPGRLRLACGNFDRDNLVLGRLVFEVESGTLWALTSDSGLTTSLTRIQVTTSADIPVAP